MTNFTGGTWRVDPAHIADVQAILEDGTALELASTHSGVLVSGQKPPRAEQYANACLFAHSKELLNFLKRLAASGEWFRGALEFNTLLHDGEELEREMLALIAKAEGGAA